MTIVCATRFTEESFFAVSVAAELAKRHRQPLWLVHVLPAGVIRSWGDRLDTAATAALESEARPFKQAGLDVEVALLHGKLDPELSRFCLDKSASLLVVGDTSKQMSHLTAGTLDRLAYGVQTPLLVVRDPRPFQAWASGTGPLKVMLAIDHTASSAVARDWLIRLAEFGDLDVVAAHIWWPREEYERRRLAVPPAEEGHTALSKTMRAETESALSALPKNVKHRIHLEMGVGRIADHLLALANEEQVDVIVLGTHRRRALGRLFSVSHHVLALAPMAVACIPATAVVPDLSTVASFHTALAATDFSRAGNRAVTCALGVVAHGTVHVVHVSNEPFSPGHEAAQLKKLAEALPPDAERNGARVLVHVLHGEVASEILKATDKLGAEVVCLGAKAETMLNSAVLTEVIRRSGRPVLIAPPVKT